MMMNDGGMTNVSRDVALKANTRISMRIDDWSYWLIDDVLNDNDGSDRCDNIDANIDQSIDDCDWRLTRRVMNKNRSVEWVMNNGMIFIMEW